jgi:hypothetical protein
MNVGVIWILTLVYGIIGRLFVAAADNAYGLAFGFLPLVATLLVIRNQMNRFLIGGSMAIYGLLVCLAILVPGTPQWLVNWQAFVPLVAWTAFLVKTFIREDRQRAPRRRFR